MVDFGYDISDCAVDPLFGTLDDLPRAAWPTPVARYWGDHRLGPQSHLRRSSVDFVDARSGPDSAHRNWYVWRPDAAPDGGPPNNWAAAFTPGAPAWTSRRRLRAVVPAPFEPAQPDLNWDKPDVVSAMHDVLRFWLDRGVRRDPSRCHPFIGKDPDLPDDSPEVAATPPLGPQRRGRHP